jgi:hypothetical protein
MGALRTGSLERRRIRHLREPPSVLLTGDDVMKLLPRQSPPLGVNPENLFDRARIAHSIHSQSDNGCHGCELG